MTFHTKLLLAVDDRHALVNRVKKKKKKEKYSLRTPWDEYMFKDTLLAELPVYDYFPFLTIFFQKELHGQNGLFIPYDITTVKQKVMEAIG